MGAFGRLAGSASRAAGMVLDAVDKELDAGTSDASKYQRKLAAASQRRIELAVEERRRSQKTDLSFIEKANQRALERLLAQTSIEIGNRDKTETQTFEIDGRVVEVDDVDPWVRPSPEAASTRSPSEPPGPVLSSLRPFRPRASHPTRPTPTREGTHVRSRRAREAPREPWQSRRVARTATSRRRGTRRTRSRSRRFGGTSDPYVLLELDGETRKTEVIPRSLRPVWGARFELVAAKALADSALTLSVFDHDAFGSHEGWKRGGVRRSRFDPSKRARRTSARTGCVFAPSRHHRPRTAGRFGSDAIWTRMCPGGYACTSWVREASRRRARAALDPHVRVSLLRLGEGQVPKADDARRTKTVYKTLEPCGTSISCTNTWTGRATSTLLLELFYQEYVSADRETAQIVLPVAALPRARPGIHAANRWIDRGRSTRRIGT